MGNHAQEFRRLPCLRGLFKILPYSLSNESSHEETMGGRNIKSMPASTRRWKPTAEQLAILGEVYNSGIQSPSSDQIDQITLHLSTYGEIQGKNVFYWFQNHKWSDRQKKRRATDQASVAKTSSSSSNCITKETESLMVKNQRGADEAEESSTRKRPKLGQTALSASFCNDDNDQDILEEEKDPYGRREGGALQTLQLFPLHPTYKDKDHEGELRLKVGF